MGCLEWQLLESQHLPRDVTWLLWLFCILITVEELCYQQMGKCWPFNGKHCTCCLELVSNVGAGLLQPMFLLPPAQSERFHSGWLPQAFRLKGMLLGWSITEHYHWDPFNTLSWGWVISYPLIWAVCMRVFPLALSQGITSCRLRDPCEGAGKEDKEWPRIWINCRQMSGHFISSYGVSFLLLMFLSFWLSGRWPALKYGCATIFAVYVVGRPGIISAR